MWEYDLEFWQGWRCFRGRSRRADHWYVVLIQTLLLLGAMLLNLLLPLPRPVSSLVVLYFTLSLFPLAGLQTRRPMTPDGAGGGCCSTFWGP